MIKKLSVTSFDIFCTFLLELGCFSVTFLIHFQFPEQEGYSLSKVFSMKHNNIRQSPHKIHIRSYFMFAYALDLDRFLSDVFFATADQTGKGIMLSFQSLPSKELLKKRNLGPLLSNTLGLYTLATEKIHEIYVSVE